MTRAAEMSFRTGRHAGDTLFFTLRERLLDELKTEGDPSDGMIRGMIDRMITENEKARRLPAAGRVLLAERLFSSIRRLDVLQELIDDPSVTEIMVNGPSVIYVEREGRIRRWDRTFESREKLEDVVQKIAGACNRVINERIPIVDARLPDGSRVNAVTAPVALDGPILTIRRFPKDPITMRSLVERGSVSPEAARLLEGLVRAGYSILISGGTSAGKTTFLNALSHAIPPEERVITIEDNAELQIQGIGNLVRLEAKPANMEGTVSVTIRDLIRSALRMRPNRIIVGECRGAEAVDMLQALNTGHDGSMSTLHANSAEDALHRLETMVLMAFPLPLPAIRSQIASGVRILVHLGRLPDRSRRVLEIRELTGIRDGAVTLSPLFDWDDKSRTLRRTGTLQNRAGLIRAGIEYESLL